MTAVELFENPVLDEVASFVGNNRNSGPRFSALHAALIERVLPARAKYRAAVEAASKDKAAMESRHAEALKLREALVAQLNELGRFIAETIPAEIKAADAAPAQIAAQANESLAEGDVALIESAIQSFLSFHA